MIRLTLHAQFNLFGGLPRGTHFSSNKSRNIRDFQCFTMTNALWMKFTHIHTAPVMKPYDIYGYTPTRWAEKNLLVKTSLWSCYNKISLVWKRQCLKMHATVAWCTSHGRISHIHITVFFSCFRIFRIIIKMCIYLYTDKVNNQIWNVLRNIKYFYTKLSWSSAECDCVCLCMCGLYRLTADGAPEYSFIIAESFIVGAFLVIIMV